MNFINVSDNHTHSINSFDGNMQIPEMMAKSNELGLVYLTVTDHCECEREGRNDISSSFNDIKEKKKIFSNLLTGVEMGQPLQNLQLAKSIVKMDFDFILASLHSLNNDVDFYFWDNNRTDFLLVLEKYFDELENMINWGEFDSLAHMSYPLRYPIKENGEHYTFDDYMDRVRKIFSLLIEKEIALELNCSRLVDIDIKKTPEYNLFKLYKSMGGTLVTLGSDAHKENQIGRGLTNGLELLYDLGYEEYTIYIKREAKMIRFID